MYSYAEWVGLDALLSEAIALKQKQTGNNIVLKSKGLLEQEKKDVT